jgi:hypothetical protein
LAQYYIGNKPRIINWGRNVVGVQGKRNEYRVLVKKLKERDHSEDRGIDGSIILKCKLKD